MNLIIDGRGKKKILVQLMVTFYERYLKVEKSKCTLLVQLRKDMIKEVGANGMTTKVADVVIIAIDTSLQYDDFIRTFAHEMVHVKQLIRGTLRFNDGNIGVWRGKALDVPYLKKPWEIEALREQELMARQFNEFIDKYACLQDSM